MCALNLVSGPMRGCQQGPALRACREDLDSHGFSAELSVHELGLGKMFVPFQLAPRVLEALRRRGTTSPHEIVVSRTFEAAVLSAARRTQL